MERIDIHLQVPRVEYQKLRNMRKGESSAEIGKRVEAARERQHARFDGTEMVCIANMLPAQVRNFCTLDDTCQALMKTAMRQLQLTRRAYYSVL